MRSAGNRSNAECRMRNAFTEAFTPLGAGLIMEETRLGLVRKSKITNCATPCNTVASIRSFLRANEGNEGDWERRKARDECGQPKLIGIGAVEWRNVRLCSLMFAYVRLTGKKMLR